MKLSNVKYTMGENPKRIQYLIKTKIYNQNELEKIIFTKNLEKKVGEYNTKKNEYIRNYRYNIIRNLRNRYSLNPHKDVTRLIELLSNIKT